MKEYWRPVRYANGWAAEDDHGNRFRDFMGRIVKFDDKAAAFKWCAERNSDG